MVPLVPTFAPMVTLAPLVPLAAEKRSGFSCFQWYLWLPMVPLVKFPMVPLGESRTHAMSLSFSTIKKISKKENGKKSVFHDDCGVWDSGSGMSPKTPYLITSNGHLKKIFLRNKDGRVYCTERQINQKRVYIPIEPQPDANEVVTVQRYYVSLSLSNSYRKGVTYLWEGGLKTKLALVEYIGKFPGLSAHGNTKSGNGEYIRTPVEVLDEVG